MFSLIIKITYRCWDSDGRNEGRDGNRGFKKTFQPQTLLTPFFFAQSWLMQRRTKKKLSTRHQRKPTVPITHQVGDISFCVVRHLSALLSIYLGIYHLYFRLRLPSRYRCFALKSSTKCFCAFSLFEQFCSRCFKEHVQNPRTCSFVEFQI